MTSGKVVAIKKLKQKYESWTTCSKLLELHNHANIVKIKHFIYENSEFIFLFEYTNTNLRELITHRNKPFSKIKVRNWMFQVLTTIEYMHKVGYLHKDLKPCNLLISKNIIKEANFGMFREIMLNKPYTSNATTIWYQAFKVLMALTLAMSLFFGTEL